MTAGHSLTVGQKQHGQSLLLFFFRAFLAFFALSACLHSSQKIAALFKELGMPFRAHVLRHTFITNAYELGFPQYLVQRWVGHASFEEDNTYLALRRADEFIETEVVRYMRELKKLTVWTENGEK